MPREVHCEMLKSYPELGGHLSGGGLSLSSAPFSLTASKKAILRLDTVTISLNSAFSIDSLGSSRV